MGTLKIGSCSTEPRSYVRKGECGHFDACLTPCFCIGFHPRVEFNVASGWSYACAEETWWLGPGQDSSLADKEGWNCQLPSSKSIKVATIRGTEKETVALQWQISKCAKHLPRDHYTSMWVFPKIVVPPNHPILIGISFIFTIHFGGTPYFRKHPYVYQICEKRGW